MFGTDLENLSKVQTFDIYLVEPWALKNEHTPSEEFQNDVVFYEHLQHDAGRSTKHSHQQQGVDVRVQRGPHVDVVIEQEAWRNMAEKEIAKETHLWCER